MIWRDCRRRRSIDRIVSIIGRPRARIGIRRAKVVVPFKLLRRARTESDQPPIIVPHSELDWLNCSPVEWPQVQEVDNPMHCEA